MYQTKKADVQWALAQPGHVCSHLYMCLLQTYVLKLLFNHAWTGKWGKANPWAMCWAHPRGRLVKYCTWPGKYQWFRHMRPDLSHVEWYRRSLLRYGTVQVQDSSYILYHGASGRSLLRYGKIQGPSHMYTIALRAEYLSDRVRSSCLIPWYRDILSHLVLHKAHLSSYMPLFRRSPLIYGKV
jgi:hypothetical protein